MREFEADITRDGTVCHLAWGSHMDAVRHFNIPENTSEWRQNYYEYDLRAPFTDNLGLQARGIEDPPEAVLRSAERLTEKLRNWHQGRDLRSIPEDWGDVVEHVYEVRGSKTPKYLNGRGGVYFCEALEEVRDRHIHRLLGTARIVRLVGSASVGQMWGQSRVDEMRDASRVESTWQSAKIGKLFDRARIDMMCQSSSVEEMRDNAQILIMHGASRVLALYDKSLCARGYDGTVHTPDRKIKKRVVLAINDRWKTVRIIRQGEGVFA